MTHPLTDEICEQIRDSIPKLPHDEQGRVFSYDGQRILDGMFEELSEVSNAEIRSAADWQLDRVLDWLDKNLSNYTDDTYLGDMIPLHRLDDDLKEAMRPAQKNNK